MFFEHQNGWEKLSNSKIKTPQGQLQQKYCGRLRHLFLANTAE